MRNLLNKYLPENAIDLYLSWQQQQPHQLVITKPRKTKLGDYRPPQGRRHYHKLTVNGDLNKYQFLITLVHEVAHLFTFIEYGRTVKAHGKEWKNIYTGLLKDTIATNCFPKNLLPKLNRHSKNPSASSCVDVALYKALRQFSNQHLKLPLVEDVEQGKKFMLKNGKHFIKGPLLRKRYKCEEVGTGKIYTVSPIAEVVFA